MSIVEDAMKFATEAHEGQMRKYTGQKYIDHPAEVASIVSMAGGSPEMIAAAWLHDVVEDTKVTHDDIWGRFGPTIASLVLELTNVDKAAGNRKTRKAIDLTRLTGISDDAKIIKVADLISNSRTIIECDPKFAEMYISERDQILKVMNRRMEYEVLDY